MLKVGNLVLLGTSHIARESITAVSKAIDGLQPGVVALELDRGRLHALLHPSKEKLRLRDIRHIGVKGYLFGLLGAWAERKLGHSVGTAPGDEMRAAVRVCRERKIPVALVDQDIHITLRRLSRALSWRERWRFFVDIVGSVVKREKLPFDLHTVPSEDVIGKLTGQVRVRYPNVYRVLITERNEFMADRLSRILRAAPDKTVLAVIGAGHVKDVAGLVRKSI